MRFSVIYSFECPTDLKVEDFHPPKAQRRKGLWELTEQADPPDSESGDKHRKWAAAFLTRAQFNEFLEKTELDTREQTSTMGSIGCPGFGFAWMPAVSFNGHEGVWGNAYVTPVPEWFCRLLDQGVDITGDHLRQMRGFYERFDRIERALWSAYE